MRIKNWLFSKKLAIALIVLAIISILLMAIPAYATDAMKPGNGHGDVHHVHFGSPGHPQ